jgi:hypothetical protein
MANSRFVHDLTVVRVFDTRCAQAMATALVVAGLWFQMKPCVCGNWEIVVKVEDDPTLRKLLKSGGIKIEGEKNRYFQTGGIVETSKGEPREITDDVRVSEYIPGRDGP